MAPYGPIRFLQDRADEYTKKNLTRYAWIFKMYTHFHLLDISRPAEYIGTISRTLDMLKNRENKNSCTYRILHSTTELLKSILKVKPLKSKDVIDDKEYNNMLTSLQETSTPLIVFDEPLRQVTSVPDGFEKSMKYVVSTVIEGCIFATANIEIFCRLQKAVCKMYLKSGRHRICNFKGIEMIYVILDRGYLK